jgi:hypothetical protein
MKGRGNMKKKQTKSYTPANYGIYTQGRRRNMKGDVKIINQTPR